MSFFFKFDWVLSRTNKVLVIMATFQLLTGGRPQVPLCALFQAQRGT
jgi:hypothetical protein